MNSIFFALAAFSLVGSCLGHGRMMKPPSRNAMWRVDEFKGKVPANYNDNEQNCGGFAAQWEKNQGKCGVCGDQYDKKQQDHIQGGKFATGTIGKTYKQGETIEILIDITSNHYGWFEFRVADIGKPPITQKKLNANLLKVVGATKNPNRFEIPKGTFNQVFKMEVVLPEKLVCNHCVIQWWWNTGNSWGCDKSGCGIGFGKQETFVNCADIKILPKGVKPDTKPPVVTTEKPTTTKVRATTVATTDPPSPEKCRAVNAFKNNKRINSWCQKSCPDYCPSTFCTCT